MRIFICIFISLYVFGCRGTQPSNYSGNLPRKQIFIVYDQPMWSWPGKNSTEIIVPGIYLPLQQKAFQLERVDNRRRRVLHLIFSQQDDSSTIQIMANRFSYRNWLYKDTVLKIADLSAPINCFRMEISTYKTNKHGFIPELSLAPFECSGTEPLFKTRRKWIFNIPANYMHGGDPSIYVRKGYLHLFRKPLIPTSPIINVADLDL